MDGRLDVFFYALRKLTDIITVPGLVVLVILLLSACIIAGYMLLKFGDHGLEMFMPFVRENFRTLRSEVRKAHPAIRIELIFHIFFGSLAFVCMLAVLLHSLIPWVRDDVERLFVFGFISSVVVCVVLAGISLKIAVRLD